jgi:hypothetical protein
MDIALARDGSLYVTSGFQTVRRITPGGRIFTMAGTGSFGGSGDGLPAVQATVANPRGLALGSDGGLFIVDAGTERVRRVGPEGVITAIIGEQGVGGGFSCSAASRSTAVPFSSAMRRWRARAPKLRLDLLHEGAAPDRERVGCLRRVGPTQPIKTVHIRPHGGGHFRVQAAHLDRETAG